MPQARDRGGQQERNKGQRDKNDKKNKKNKHNKNAALTYGSESESASESEGESSYDESGPETWVLGLDIVDSRRGVQEARREGKGLRGLLLRTVHARRRLALQPVPGR